MLVFVVVVVDAIFGNSIAREPFLGLLSLGDCVLPMTKKGTKATRKFAKSGELKRTIDNRRKHQNLKKKIQARKAVRGAALTRDADSSVVAEGEMNEERETKGKREGKGRAKAVDFLDDKDEEPDHKDEKIVSKGK